MLKREQVLARYLHWQWLGGSVWKPAKQTWPVGTWPFKALDGDWGWKRVDAIVDLHRKRRRA